MNKIIVALLVVGGASTAWSFQGPSLKWRKSLPLHAKLVDSEKTATLAKMMEIFDATESARTYTPYQGKMLEDAFPGALSNNGMENKVLEILTKKGFTPSNTLLATSLCCDELARQLEDDFNKIFGSNFNLGGLSGFPFAGNTGFGAMAAHIPDDGYCLIVYGPHVGITKKGEVGKVERKGIKLVDTCCGSAIAASNYLKGITDGGAKVSIQLQEFTDFQQGAVQELILPHGKRLKEAKNRMIELPYALFASQDLLMGEIVAAGAKGAKNKNGIALLGGIQINTGPDTMDYFVPLRFDLVNTKGEQVECLLDELTGGKTTAAPAAASSSSSEPEKKSIWSRLFG